MAYIARLSLKNFRSYKNLDINFFEGINFIYGDNGQGKTNILEAINFISLLKSFRTNQNKDLFHWGEKEFFLGAIIEELGGEKLTLKVNYGKNNQFFYNDYPVKQAVDFVNNFQTISFLPEDINIIKGSSSLRRSLLNIDVSRLNSNYLFILKNCNKLLKIRNHLFRKSLNISSLDKMYLNSFDEKLIHYNELIYKYRWNWFSLFSTKLKKISKLLFNSEKVLEVHYKPSINIPVGDDFKDKVKAIFKKNFERDFNHKITYSGCHRDDFELFFKGKKLDIYGSQGQCRLASLALKLTTAEILFEDEKIDKLVFLIDDVLGELDDNTKKVFFHSLEKTHQSFITSTNFDKNIFTNLKRTSFNLTGGKIIKNY